MNPCAIKESLMVEDVMFLLKATCNLYTNIRTKSLQFLREYVTKFPFILTYQPVLFLFLDIIGALYNELYLPYDSLSHVLKLPHTGQIVILPVEKVQKEVVFKMLIKLLEELYIKGALINEQELVGAFQEYVHKTISRQKIDSPANFGICFLHNLYANYKNYEVGFNEKLTVNYLAKLSEFNQEVDKLIAQSNY